MVPNSRAAGGKGLGAVDRIDHPDEFGPVVLLAEFLADHAMRGKFLPDHRAQFLLDLAIGLGNGGFIFFLVDHEIFAGNIAVRSARRHRPARQKTRRIFFIIDRHGLIR